MDMPKFGNDVYVRDANGDLHGTPNREEVVCPECEEPQAGTCMYHRGYDAWFCFVCGNGARGFPDGPAD